MDALSQQFPLRDIGLLNPDSVDEEAGFRVRIVHTLVVMGVDGIWMNISIQSSE
ncbi:hypothetical protein NSU08_05675 [Paenibacillus sp. FSL H7-0331]|uniref:hypothetical protein n=1 Tax=Paenibacillus sp. FSL H7-0331 TaxID=1920421 RepID=UPI0030F931A0